MIFVESAKSGLKNLQSKFGFRIEHWPLFIIGLLLLFIALIFMRGTAINALEIALFLAPLWLPFLLISSAVSVWYIWQRSEAIARTKMILLEIKPPRTVTKTPLAMEAFISTLHMTGGESNWWALLNGGTRATWSLEIASFEGQVHFYIYGRESWRRMVESQLYAQYPGVQVIEAVDYTRTMDIRPETFNIWGCDYKHTEKDSDAVPIKTYVNYGLDKPSEDYEQVDPLANLIEFMGSIGKGEYIWLQYVIRAHKGEKYQKTKEDGSAHTWKDEALALIEKIKESARQKSFDPATGKEIPGFLELTTGQSDKIASIERNIAKLPFDVGARAVYIAKPDKFRPVIITHMISLFKPFTAPGWNGIDSTKWMKSFDDFPWEIGTDKVKDKYRRDLIEAYRRRQFFHHPFYEGGLHANETMVMSTEELATIFHIPSAAVATPGLGRIQSATAEAPVNLPT